MGLCPDPTEVAVGVRDAAIRDGLLQIAEPSFAAICANRCSCTTSAAGTQGEHRSNRATCDHA